MSKYVSLSRLFVNGAELAKQSQRRRTNGAEPPVSSSVDWRSSIVARYKYCMYCTVLYCINDLV